MLQIFQSLAYKATLLWVIRHARGRAHDWNARENDAMSLLRWDFVHGHFLAPKMSSPQAISTLHTPCTLVRHSGLAPSSKAPPKLFPRFTSHPRSSGTRVSLLPAKLPQSYFHTASHPRSSGNPVSLLPAQLFPSYFRESFLSHARPAFPSRSFQRSSCLALSSGAPLKLFPHFTPHPRSSGTPVSPPSGALPKLFPSFTSHPLLVFVSLLPAKLSPAIYTLHTPSTLVHSRLAPSSGAPLPLFPRFTPHPRSSGTPVSLLPKKLPPSYFHVSQPSGTPGLAPLAKLHFHASHPIHARPALRSRSFLRSSPQAIRTLHIPSTFVRHSRLAPSSGAPPKLVPRFTSHPRSSGTSQSYFCASHPIHNRPALSGLAELPPSYFHA